MTVSTTSPDQDQDHPVRAATARWRDAILSPAGDRLVELPVTAPDLVDLSGPGAAAAVTQLLTGARVDLRAAPDAALDSDPGAGDPVRRIPVPTRGRRRVRGGRAAFTGAGPDVDLAAVLRRVAGPVEQSAPGEPGLHLAFGVLVWSDEDGDEHRSPILLVPVRVVQGGPNRRPGLVPTGEDPLLNPALAGIAGIELPPLPATPPFAPGPVLAQVAAAATARSGRVEEVAVLGRFDVAAALVHHDLVEHEDRIAAHPVVRGLAGEPGPGFEPVPVELVDEVAPPETTTLVLDADASQRVAVAAALAGHSFGLETPSDPVRAQTVTTLVAALLQAGRTVLVVSARTASLDAVRDELTRVGLGAYLLGLYAGRATGARVATALAAALRHRPDPVTPLDPERRHELARLRAELDAYAIGINAERPPLGVSLHHVLGRIALLAEPPSGVRNLPGPPPAGIADLTIEGFARVQDAAAGLATAWRPVAEGMAFGWRGLITDDDLDGTLERCDSALRSLRSVVAELADVTSAFGVTRPSEALALAGVLDLWAQRPAGADTRWLGLDRLDEVRAAVDLVQAGLTAVAGADERADLEAGVPWRTLPMVDRPPLGPASGDLPEGTPPALELGDLTAARCTQLADRLAMDAGMVDRRRLSLAKIAEMLGLPEPQTLQQAGYLLFVASLAGLSNRPEASWFSVPGAERARAAARALKTAITELDAAEQAARQLFTDMVRWSDVDGLAARFATEHQGWRRMGRAYRDDRTAVARVLREGIDIEVGITSLPLAARWKSGRARLAAAEFEHAAALGGYYNGRETDFDLIERVLADVARILHPQVDLSAAARVLARDVTPPADLLPMAARTRQDLEEWRNSFAPPPAAASPPEFGTLPLADATVWMRAHVAPLRAAAELAAAVSAAVGSPVTVSRARELVLLRSRTEAAHDAFTDPDGRLAQTLGDLYQGEETRVDTLQETLHWCERLRESTGPLTGLNPRRLAALDAATPGRRLRMAADAWESAVGELLPAFEPDRRPELASQLDDFDTAADLLDALRSDPEGRAEWFTSQAHRAVLTDAGLDDVLDRCGRAGVAPEQLPDLLERALLQAWADLQLAGGARAAAIDPEAITTAFRALDRALVATAAGEVAAALNARRPSAEGEPAATIRAQAALPHGHLPVRELLGRSADTVRALTPCVVATPADVVRHLDPRWRFDVVIVDGDPTGSALAGLHRGDAVIVTGAGAGTPGLPTLTVERADVPPVRDRGPYDEGDGALAAGPDPTTEPLEAAVAAVVRSWGYQVTGPVGRGPYRVDLAVRHPQEPERFMLGIRFDGPRHADAPSARDRDRQLDEALTGLGWRLHRVWSLGWNRDPEGERARLRAVLQHCCDPARPPGEPTATAPSPSTPSPRTQAPSTPTPSTGAGDPPVWAVPYRIAGVDPLPGWIDVGHPQARPYVAAALTSIVAVEAPVHRSVLHQRLRDAWGLSRVSSRLRGVVDEVVAAAPDLIETDGFVSSSRPVPERARTPVAGCARRLDQVPDSEIAFALRCLVHDAGRIGSKELVTALTRLFGWSRRGSDVNARFDAVVAAEKRTGGLTAVKSTFSHFTPGGGGR